MLLFSMLQVSIVVARLRRERDAWRLQLEAAVPTHLADAGLTTAIQMVHRFLGATRA